MNKIEVLKSGTVTTIGIHESFYKRLQDLATYISQSVAQEVLIEQIRLIKEDQPLSEFGQHLETLLIIVQEVENKAREQGNIGEVELPEQAEISS